MVYYEFVVNILAEIFDGGERNMHECKPNFNLFSFGAAYVMF